MIGNTEIKKTGDHVSKTTQKSRYAHIMIGLLVGIVGFFVISFFSFGRRFCSGLFISIAMGYVSGYFTFRYANIGTIENASRLGAISGGIAGIFAALGQMFGGLLPMLLFSFTEAPGMFPMFNNDTARGLFDMFFMPSLFNGILGLVAASVTGSITASKSFS